VALPSYTVWFRGKPACPCQVEWLPVFEAELRRRGVIRESIDIAQLIGDAEASGNTHKTGGAGDIWQHDPVTVWVARQMGADAAWARITGSFEFNRHTHFVLSGCPHNSAARYQIDEVRAGGDGLLGNIPDPGPRPLSGRTWREGIAWAKQLQEDEVTPEDIEKIANLTAKKILDSEINLDDEGNTAPVRRVLRWTVNGLKRLAADHDTAGGGGTAPKP
jgi:hypothetical protein